MSNVAQEFGGRKPRQPRPPKTCERCGGQYTGRWCKECWARDLLLRDTARMHTRELLGLIRQAYRLNDELDKTPLSMLRSPQVVHEMREILCRMWQITRFPERYDVRPDANSERPIATQSYNLIDDAYCDRVAAQLLDEIDL